MNPLLIRGPPLIERALRHHPAVPELVDQRGDVLILRVVLRVRHNVARVQGLGQILNALRGLAQQLVDATLLAP
jgi:hypothetical protein